MAENNKKTNGKEIADEIRRIFSDFFKESARIRKERDEKIAAIHKKIDEREINRIRESLKNI